MNSGRTTTLTGLPAAGTAPAGIRQHLAADVERRPSIRHAAHGGAQHIRAPDEAGDELAAGRWYSASAVPICAISPLSITAMRSESAIASSWSWVT